MLEQMQLVSRCYLLEVNGKFTLYSDKARAATFVMTAAHVVPGSVKGGELALRGLPNHFVGNFNDLDIPADRRRAGRRRGARGGRGHARAR
jgi:hypothetical protein